MIIDLLLFLLPVAAASGWFAAKKTIQHPSQHDESGRLVQDYLVGLNYLLNEQPDKAVDAFIKILEVDNETVETHLALGALFRRRGEVDRAIRIHQNLIARPQLSKKQRVEALLALGQDYLKAGMLDRAERLFLEIIEVNGDYKIKALAFLVDIYQQQKRWEAAITFANKLAIEDPSIYNTIAHYYCELAIIAKAQNGEAINAARDYLKQALAIDPNCVRANLVLGTLEFEQGNHQVALQVYQQIKNQGLEFFTEALAPIVMCYERLGRVTEVLAYFKDCLYPKQLEAENSSAKGIGKEPQIALVLALVELLRVQENNAAAIEFLTEQLRKNPSIRGLHRLIILNLENADHNYRENLLILHDATLRLLRGKLSYHCEHCGFASKILHWLCPGCKKWGSVKPVEW